MSLGERETLTQLADAAEGKNVFAHPFNVAFTGATPHGWPQLVVEVVGKSWLGNPITLGTGVCHVPVQAGRHEVDIALFAPAASSVLQGLMSVLSGIRPEYIDPMFIAGGDDRGVTKTSSKGSVRVIFNVVLKGFLHADLETV